MINTVLLLLYLQHVVYADLYLHYPRGSNNKLNEQQKNVRNDNRLFDSQNNANSGYNIGDDCNPACAVDTNNDNQANPDTYNSSLPGAGRGVMYYYAGSYLSVEWTAQHGCGKENPHLDCEVILQYACEDTLPGLRNGERIATIGGGQNDNGQNTNLRNTVTGSFQIKLLCMDFSFNCWTTRAYTYPFFLSLRLFSLVLLHHSLYYFISCRQKRARISKYNKSWS
jgi:hypothetical protein